MKFRNTLILFLIVLAGAVWIFYFEKETKTTAERESSEKKIFGELTSDDVTRVELRRDSGKIVLVRDEKDSSTWRLAEPVDAKADATEVSSILSKLEFLEKKSTLEPEGGKPLDLAEYGLDKPRLEVSVTTKKASTKPTTIAIGSDGVSGSLYAKLPEEKSVLVVDKSLWTSLDKTVDQLRDKGLVDVKSYQVTRLELKTPERTIALSKKDDDWRLASPIADLAEDERVSKLVDKATGLRAEKVVSEKSGDLATYGLTSPRLQFTISEGESKSDTILVGGDIPDSGGLVYAKNAARESIVAVKESILKDLSAEVTDLRQKKLVEFETFDVTGLSVKSGTNEVVAEKKDGKWTLAQPKDTNAEESAVTGFLDKLRGLTVKKFVADKADDPKTYGLDAGVVVTVTSSGGRKHVATFGGKDPEGNFAYAKREDVEPVIGVDPTILDLIPKSSLALRDREVLDLARFRIQKLSIEREGTTTSLEKREGDAWVVTAPVKRDADKESVDAVLNAIAPLKAKDLVAEKADDPKPYGLDAPTARLVVTSEKDTIALKKPDDSKPKPTASDDKTESYTMLLGTAAADGGSYAKIDGFDLVFRVPSSLVDAVKKDFLKRDVWDLDRDQATALEIQRGDVKLAAKRKAGEWSLTAPIEAKVDTSALDGVLRTFTKLRADRFVAKADPAVTKLDAPEFTVTVTLDKIDGTEQKTVKIGAKTEDGTGRYASASGEDLTFVLPMSSAQALTRDLVPLRIVEFATPDDVKTLDVSYESVDDAGKRDVTLAFEKGADGKWKRTKPEPAAPDAESAQVGELLVTLSALRATSVASYQPAAPSTYALDAPTLTITVGLASSKVALKVGKETSDATGEGSYASVDGRPYVYVLSKSDVERLRLKP